MKLSGKGLILFMVVAVLMGSCFDPPEYSNTPVISYVKTVYKDASNPSLNDSLIVSVTFKDGNGDLGLNDPDTLDPYNNKYYFRFLDNSLITYKTRRTNPNYDTLPAFIKPYYCLNWEIRKINGKIDTVYFQLNPNYYNWFIKFYVQDPITAEYNELNFQTDFVTGPNSCGISSNGRFPILSRTGKSVPIEGTINWGFPSPLFELIIGSRKFKVKVTIQDRSLNRSNTVESEPLLLNQIRIRV
ncbi:MAG: hypothetical protein HOP08_17795 [Cyclobacteriaceae bacterium]|nr:hypothetical protein [Cyclobacteriaceae bacterium]